MPKSICIIAVMFFFSTFALAQTDPCDCTPKRGNHPYRLVAKTETDFTKYHKRKKHITTASIQLWEARFAKRTAKDVDPDAPRLKKTPEDSLYTLDAWIYEIKKEIDCDYHVVVGTDQPGGQPGEVEVTLEICDVKKVLFDKWKSLHRAFNKKYDTGVACTIQGLGFYDGQHGIKDEAGTAWELHPVKSIMFR
jgi:hypothetical protein